MARKISLPPLHSGQQSIVRAIDRSRHTIVSVGRRYGKSYTLAYLAVRELLNGGSVLWYAPEYKHINTPFEEIAWLIRPIEHLFKIDRSKYLIRRKNNIKAKILFFSMDRSSGGRGEDATLVLMDETAHAKNRASIDLFDKVVIPTLTKTKGKVVMCSTANGKDPTNLFWRSWNEKRFTKIHAPSSASPLLDADELARIEATSHPLVFAQEFRSEFVEWSAASVINLDMITDDGKGFAPMPSAGYVGVFLDTASKVTAKSDSTAAIYVYAVPGLYCGGKDTLFVLDWDVRKFTADIILEWLPSVAERCLQLADEVCARGGTRPLRIEDAASGIALLQMAPRHGINARAIDKELTRMGKDGRMLAASNYFANKQVRFTQHALDKVMTVDGESRNWLLSQTLGYVIADPERDRKHDDCVDALVYSVLTALGGYN